MRLLRKTNLVHMPKVTFLVLSLSFLFGVCNAPSADPVKNPYRVRFGTLEVTDDVDRRYIFRSGSEEEVFSVNFMKIVGGAGDVTLGLPDLIEVGFKLDSGEIIKYPKLDRDLMLEKYFKEHPDAVVESLIFDGYLDEDLEVKGKGLTPVCRVEIEEGGSTINLWKNMPSERALPTKSGAVK